MPDILSEIPDVQLELSQFLPMNSLSPLLQVVVTLFAILMLVGCDSSASSRGTKVWVKMTPAIAAPSWEARAMILYNGDRNYPGNEMGLIDTLTDPSGQKKWQRYLARHKAREIFGGTEAWVVGREGDFRAIQLEGEETIWWVHKGELERPWGRK
jgi:hypothetical protein